jgi:hypothetical protein
VCGVAYATGGLDLLALLIIAVCDDSLRAIFVAESLWWWEFGRWLVDIVIVSPVVPMLRK